MHQLIIIKFMESIGSMSLCYLSALIDITIGNLGTTQVAPYVGITNVFLISLMIYALSPPSGGHLNPIISFTTMTAGLTGFSRGILYMIGQTLGGAVAGGLIRGSLGKELTLQYVGSDKSSFPIQALNTNNIGMAGEAVT